jgi:polyhydroxybutyrate depolymerase
MNRISPLLLSAIGLMVLVSGSRAAAPLSLRQWKVDGVTREALVYIPAAPAPGGMPIVFAFHGHGGTMQRVARAWNYQALWPDAIVVYMQGLKTPGQLTDPKGDRTGWQRWPGDQNDRDLKFFDAVLASLEKEQHVDRNRIYATGHSNGGSFTYLLWETRAKDFAAFAPSAAVSRSLMTDKQFTPRPVLVIAGRKDPLVKFSWQEKMMDALRKHNECEGGGPWKIDKRCTLYPSKVAAPVITYIHDGGHVVPPDACGLVVKFFKEHLLSQ